MTSQRYPVTPTESLPARPNLEQLKKQAKDLLKAAKAGDASVCPVLRLHVRFADSPDDAILGADLSLQEVQHIVALRYGFKDWSALRAAIEEGGARVQVAPSSEREMLVAILTAACAEGASDIHIEPGAQKTRVRFRVDGVLRDLDPMPSDLGNRVARDAMQWAALDLDKPLPQDGRFVTNAVGRDIDIRLNAMESHYGPVITMRCLMPARLIQLDATGFEPEPLQVFRAKLRLRRGLVLVAGPTGSGKTTTIYAALSEINTAQRKIVTVEDPIEYLIDGIDQVQIRPDQGVGFPRALRSVLRQDPDVIMAAEIREQETANILIQSVLTGHLALSTLHTDDAPGALIRLLDMGIPPFLVKDTVTCVLAQRLARCVCGKCREKYAPDAATLAAVGLPADTVLYRGRGCEHCNRTGFRGRTAIYSLLDITDPVREAIMSGHAAHIVAAAKAAGCESLRDAAVRKAVAGGTSLDEVVRVA